MTAPALIIDMHTHLFNANYLPLKEIFISRGIPKHLAAMLAKLVQVLAKESSQRFRLVSPNANLSFEAVLKSNITLLSNDNTHDTHFEALAGTLEDLVLSQLYLEIEGLESRFEATTSLEDSELYTLLSELDIEFGDEASAAILNLHSEHGFIAVSQNTTPLIGITDKGLFSGLRKMLERFIKKAAQFVESAGDFLDFILTMLRGEKKLLNRLEGYYADLNIPFLLVHYMMDMQYPFSGDVKYDFYKDQLPKMTSLEKLSDGTLLGFSAFDPIRCLQKGLSDAAIISLINESLAYGKVGFKFYPPMGYRAANNEEQPKLEHVVDLFFDHCAANNIPVFTHCTPEGFEQSPGKTGSNSHPKYWEACLAKPGRENLRLCFGHAGGGRRKVNNKLVHGWLSGGVDEDNWNDDDNYARWVVKLCRKYKNVYCEIAYMHEIIGSSGSSDKFKERLIIEYARMVDTEHPYAFADKIMYGSDWHMPSMVNDIDDYIHDVLQIFMSPELSEHKKSFFAGNAIRFLDLNNHLDRVSHLFSESYITSVKAKISAV